MSQNQNNLINSFINLKTFLENGRVVKYKDVFQLNEERVNSVVTKATMILERLKKYSVIDDFAGFFETWKASTNAWNREQRNEIDHNLFLDYRLHIKAGLIWKLIARNGTFCIISDQDWFLSHVPIDCYKVLDIISPLNTFKVLFMSHAMISTGRKRYIAAIEVHGLPKTWLLGHVKTVLPPFQMIFNAPNTFGHMQSLAD